jgi:hypothetical protein
MNIEKLSEKALQRNPDEFYHKMMDAVVKVRIFTCNVS